MWKHNGYYRGERSNLNLEKVKLPEKASTYINEAYLTVQKGQNIVCGDYHLFGEITPAVNVPADISKYNFEPDEAWIIVPIYDVETGTFKGLKETVPFYQYQKQC